MEKLSFNNISLVSVCLLAVSALSLSFMRSSDDNDTNANFSPGLIILSSGGDSLTAIAGAGLASYTVTASFTIPGSGTGVGTDTNLIGIYTGYNTTVG